MAKTLTQPWDAADHLENKEDIVAYLEAAFDDGDSRLITAALGDIAKSKGMTKIASEAGLGRESLYKALTDLEMKVILAGRNGFLRVSLSIRSRSSDAVVWRVVNGAFFGFGRA